MEMTFPHSAVRQDSVMGRIDHKAMLAIVMSRQANSRTVHALRQAENNKRAAGDNAEQRIHYFASHNSQEMATCGAFWGNAITEPKFELAVNQAGSTIIKDHGLDNGVTGEQLNLAGHGALRTI